jgi:hypothetical protein
MPNYYPAVQTAIPLRIYTDAAAPYTTSGTPPTLLVRKNRTGAAATATGTLTHAGNGIWDYTPASGEVSSPCTFLMLIWSGTGIAHGHEAIEFEADYTSTVAGRIDATVSSRSTLAAADIRSAVGLAAANLDTQLTTIDDFLDTEVAAIKAKTDNLPASPAATGDAMTLATDAVNSTSLAASAVTEIAAGISIATAVYAVQGIRTRISDSEDDFITLVKSDDRSVVLLFEDESHNPAMIPSTATAALLDSAGSSVGTATVTTITAAAGYMLLRLQAPSSGNLPTTLRITFTGGSGAAYKHDIPVRSFS